MTPSIFVRALCASLLFVTTYESLLAQNSVKSSNESSVAVSHEAAYTQEIESRIRETIRADVKKYGPDILLAYLDSKEIAFDQGGSMKSPKAYKAVRFMTKSFPDARLTEMIKALDIFISLKKHDIDGVISYINQNASKAELRDLVFPFGVEVFPLFYSTLTVHYMRNTDFEQSRHYLNRLKMEYPHSYVMIQSCSGPQLVTVQKFCDEYEFYLEMFKDLFKGKN